MEFDPRRSAGDRSLMGSIIRPPSIEGIAAVIVLSDRQPAPDLTSALRTIGLDVVHCDWRTQLPDAIQLFPRRVVLAYVSAGWRDGPCLYRTLYPTPVMVLAPTPTLEEVVEGLNAGAADFRSEETDPLEIAYRLRGLVRVCGSNGTSVRN
jgi:DNA-binding response OmpR family regulator